MSRSIVLSNGQMCVALDHAAEVRDIYFPHVGLEDHVRGHYMHRLGVWVDGTMSWFSEDSGWDIKISCEEQALASIVVARHDGLAIELTFKDIVYNEKPVFIRRISIKNMGGANRVIKFYASHQFEIYKQHGGDTAYYDPLSHSVIHYKGRRVFLIGATLDGQPFDDYAIGIANFNGQEGSHRDANDGELSKNAIEHGPVDSVIGLYGSYAPGQSRVAYYWIAAAQSVAEAHELNAYIAKKSPEHMVKTAASFWNAWVNAYIWNFHGLSSEHVALFRRSLMYVRAHVDNEGGVLASIDSDMLQHGLDTYAYVWVRDASYAALALDKAGDTNVAKRFFEFCRDVITEDGYFMHKYLPDRSLGSSWHPWVRDGQFQLPIQEDETALAIIALREHYRHSRDLEFLEEMYNPLVERAANFMVRYRDTSTGLPQPSYDLWEEKRGASTFTTATVYGALIAAAELSAILGKNTHESQYREAAESVKVAMMKHLWDEENGVFYRMLSPIGEPDRTIDMSSVYGVFAYGVLPIDDPRLRRAFEQTVRSLSHGIERGGLARYLGDAYYRSEDRSSGNPWFITTLWYAEYLIASARNERDLDRVREIFSWVVRHAQPSGVLSEQVHPVTGAQLSASPLTWSHAGYVTAVLKYLDKLEELGIAPASNPNP